MPEITSVTSEALQATIRRLLPSQQGFGDDLQATNLITPIIDLTPTAEGSSVPQYLQQAGAFGSQTDFQTRNGTTNHVTGGGFYRILGNIGCSGDALLICEIRISDGTSEKVITAYRQPDNSGEPKATAVTFDEIVFLRPTDTLQSQSNSDQAIIVGSFRQVADSNGNLVNPSGFTPQ